jgi:hypothetical protein
MAAGAFPQTMTVQQPPFIKMILLAVVLHALLGWQLWIGVAIVCLIPTSFDAALLLSQKSARLLARLVIAFQMYAGAVMGGLVAYIPMILVFLLDGTSVLVKKP